MDSGDLVVTATDSALPSYVYAGIYSYVADGYTDTVKFDAWEASDMDMLAGDITGSGALVGHFVKDVPLNTAITGSATVTANIRKNIEYLAADITGSGLVTANFVRKYRSFPTDIVSSGLITGNLLLELAYESAITGSGIVTANLQTRTFLNVSVSGSGNIVPVFSRRRSLAGS